MRTIRATYRLILFFGITVALFSLWHVGRLFTRDRVRFRQRLLFRWTKSFARTSGMHVEVRGPRPEPPFFLVTNHVSYADIAALRTVVNGVFVAKAEVRGWFFVGRLVDALGTIFIDRSNRRDIPRAGDEIIQRLDAGEGVVVFPEGTSTGGNEVLPFNSSFFAFAAMRDLPVSYAAIRYTTPPGEAPASRVVCWGDDISFFAHFWRLLKLPHFTAVITFGDEPVVDHDRKQLAVELHRRVSELFVPVE